MATEIVNCKFCGKNHGVRCPEIKAIEYHSDGSVKRIEFMTAADYLAPAPLYPAQPWPPWPPLVPSCGPKHVMPKAGMTLLQTGRLTNAGHG